MSGIPAELRALYEANGQANVFRFADRGLLSDSEVEELVSQLERIDPARVDEIFKQATSEASGAQEVEPEAATVPLASADPIDVDKWRRRGLAAVRTGEVAAVVLAGGQGTRLGFEGPKGAYDIGLPSRKTLFRLQAERLRRLREIAALEEEDRSGAAASKPIPWYVMTSPLNDADTRQHFSENDFFGLAKEDVFFFQQGTLPCLTQDGLLLLETGSRVAEAPDGNGGLFHALKASGALADMEKRGVALLHVFSVDNALLRPADPVFVGFCLERKAPCGNKCVAKTSPSERVGVAARRGGRPCVVEYTELPRALCEQRVSGGGDGKDPNGRLVFGAANICNHLFARRFIEDFVLPSSEKLFHAARKKIPPAEEATGATAARPPDRPNGVKLESFVFDVFPLAESVAVLETQREDEFAPVKNAPKSPDGDSPDTARSMLADQARRWVVAAGAVVQSAAAAAGEAACEISPLVSYAGEGLGALRGKTLEVPFYIEAAAEGSCEDFVAEVWKDGIRRYCVRPTVP